MQQAPSTLDALAAIERRARHALRDLAAGGATNGRTALMAIADEAGDARRHARDTPAPFGHDADAVREQFALTLHPELMR